MREGSSQVPIGQIWFGAMMLEHLGRYETPASVLRAIEIVLAESDCHTPDIGGIATTRELRQTIADSTE